MMGICKSCFGGSKYLGQSPVEDTILDADAQKLLPRNGARRSVICEEPINNQISDDSAQKEAVAAADKEVLNKVEGGDSGTCVDELCEKRELSLSKDQEESPDEPREAYLPDAVQLTVSSIGSLGGVLEDVPEHCELGATDQTSLTEATETVPLIPVVDSGSSKPTPKLRHHSFGSQRTTILASNPVEVSGRRQFVIHKVNSKSLLNSGIKYDGSRQSSRNSSISGPSKSSLPPSRGSSRPPSKPPSRSSSRAPSPDMDESKHSEKLKPRFSVIGVEGPPRKSFDRGMKEKSPGVSFAKAGEMLDFSERQYQTVHAGCEIKVKSNFRDRTRSGRLSRDGRKFGTGSRPSIIDWPMGKLTWLKDRQRQGSKVTVSKTEVGKEGDLCITEDKEEDSIDLSPKTRPRSKSDRFTRPSKKQVVDVYKQAAFDWPLGQIGKFRQKYQKSKSASRSKSDANIAELGQRKLKRRSSERPPGKSRKVAFEDQQSVPWWNYPIKLMRNATSSTGTSSNKKKRRRHSTDPESRSRGGLEPETRRRTSSLSTPHRASDVQVDPVHSAILFRDARGLPASDPFLSFTTLQTLQNDEAQIFVKFFGFHKCYDLIPTSAKLVVFDTQLLVKKAFFALVYNGVRAAPLWDSHKQRFVGMLTITDFIRILQMNYRSPTLEMEELEEHRLSTWRNVLQDVKELIYIDPDASLYDAIKTLIHNKIHRLPVIDTNTGNVLYILTHKRILRFLFLYIGDLPSSSFLSKSILELEIGTYKDIEVAYEETPIIEALHKFVNKRVSALPIVDKEGRLIDIYAKFDVINLAAEKTYSNLDVSLKTANQHRNEWFEGVHKCIKTDTLYQVMERIVKAEVHRLVIVDEENVVCGVISLSDILNFLVLRPGGDDLTQKLAATKTEDVVKEDDAASPQKGTGSTPSLCEESVPTTTEAHREVVTESRHSLVHNAPPEVTGPEVNVDTDSCKGASDACESVSPQETSDPSAVQVSIGVESAVEEISNAVEATDLQATADTVLLKLTENPIRTTVLQAVTNVERGIKIKESIVKSDSTDSAFEATEELEEEGHENACEQSALSVEIERSVIVQENCDKKVEDISSDLS